MTGKTDDRNGYLFLCRKRGKIYGVEHEHYPYSVSGPKCQGMQIGKSGENRFFPENTKFYINYILIEIIGYYI